VNGARLVKLLVEIGVIRKNGLRPYTGEKLPRWGFVLKRAKVTGITAGRNVKGMALRRAAWEERAKNEHAGR